MAEYAPTYRMTAPLTIEHLEARVNELGPIHAYATAHDDVLVLDELFCRIVALEHRIILWGREHEQQSRMAVSLKELDRDLKWAWLAREEEDHASGMYADKLKETIAVLQELYVFLQSVRHVEATPAERQQEGMTREEAEALAALIKTRLPQAEVEVKEHEPDGAWMVEARNPRRGTSQVFLSADQFEQLMQETERS